MVSTNKTEKLHGGKLLIVEEWNLETKTASGQPKVALDLMGAGAGELVMCVCGSSARQTEQTEKRPVDMAIIGIVDQAELNGAVCYKKYAQDAAEVAAPVEKMSEAAAGQAEATEKAEPPAAAVSTAGPATILQNLYAAAAAAKGLPVKSELQTDAIKPAFQTAATQPVPQTDAMKPAFQTAAAQPVPQTDAIKPAFQTAAAQPVPQTDAARAEQAKNWKG